jgi:hypothetical protein
MIEITELEPAPEFIERSGWESDAVAMGEFDESLRANGAFEVNVEFGFGERLDEGFHAATDCTVGRAGIVDF